MKLFTRDQLKQGQHWPDSWISIGRHDRNEWYLHLKLPFFHLRTEMDQGWWLRTGWFVPMVTLIVCKPFFGNYAAWLQFGMAFHSDLMGEQQTVSHMPWRSCDMQLGRYVEKITKEQPES